MHQLFGWFVPQWRSVRPFSKHYVLKRNADQAELVLRLSCGRGKAGDPACSANQTQLDNVVLSVRPGTEPLGLIMD